MKAGKLIAWTLLIYLLLPRASLGAEDPENESGAEEEETSETQPHASPFEVNFYALFFGPSLQGPTGYQPAMDGSQDLDRPVTIKNFLGLGYNFNDSISIAATAYWSFQFAGQSVYLRDPFLKVAHNSLVHVGNFNLYGDVRVHFPISSLSREADLLAAGQIFTAASYEVGETGLSLGLNTSMRGNLYGMQGVGDDLQLYIAPNVSYQIFSKLAVNLVLEMQGSHVHGQTQWGLVSDGTDLEPGLTFEPVSGLLVNPYLHLYPFSSPSWKSTSFGMFLSWKVI